MRALTKFHKIADGWYWRLEFKAADMWVGVYLGGPTDDGLFNRYYICIVPMFPIRIDVERTRERL